MRGGTEGTPSQGVGQPTLPDSDPAETQEWLDSFDAVVDHAGRDPRTRDHAQRPGARPSTATSLLPGPGPSDYVNTIPRSDEPVYPGDEEIERRIRAYVRWNAAMIVHRAQRPGLGVGGHISTYASTATLYEVGFNHFFRGHDADGGGDQVYFQGHASPGIYARAFLEGRLSERQVGRLPPGGLARWVGRRPPVVPAPPSDAGLLGVHHRVDGPGRHQRDLPGTVQPLSARPWHQGHQSTSTCGRSSAMARWTSQRHWVPSAWRPGKAWTTSPSSSTATCSDWTVRYAATARSSRSSSPTSAEPAGTSSRSSGDTSGTGFSTPITKAPSSTC